MKYCRRLLNVFLASYYESIVTMPIGRFVKCMAGDLSHISRNGYFSEKQALNYWGAIFDQHIKAHGLPDSYVAYIKKMARALNYYDETYQGKRWQVVKARASEAEAKALLVEEGEKIEKTCARISKFMGFPVRADKCSVVEFYNYLSIMATN